MSEAIVIEVPAAELLDKITILEIKRDRILDAAKLANVRHELAVLEAARARYIRVDEAVEALTRDLRRANERIWELEDLIRDCEHRGDFGAPFVAVAREIYRTNDERARVKRELNRLLASQIVEEKSYQPY